MRLDARVNVPFRVRWLNQVDGMRDLRREVVQPRPFGMANGRHVADHIGLEGQLCEASSTKVDPTVKDYVYMDICSG